MWKRFLYITQAPGKDKLHTLIPAKLFSIVDYFIQGMRNNYPFIFILILYISFVIVHGFQDIFIMLTISQTKMYFMIKYIDSIFKCYHNSDKYL
jgi:hypothetical protein